MADIKKLLQSLNMSEDQARSLVNQQDNPSVFTRMEQPSITDRLANAAEYLGASQHIPESPYNAQNAVGAMPGAITKAEGLMISKLPKEELLNRVKSFSENELHKVADPLRKANSENYNEIMNLITPKVEQKMQDLEKKLIRTTQGRSGLEAEHARLKSQLERIKNYEQKIGPNKLSKDPNFNSPEYVNQESMYEANPELNTLENNYITRKYGQNSAPTSEPNYSNLDALYEANPELNPAEKFNTLKKLLKGK